MRSIIIKKSNLVIIIYKNVLNIYIAVN